MGLLLKIIGVVAIVVVLALVFGAMWLWRMFKGMAKTEAEGHPPCRITVEPEDNPVWRNEKQVLDYAAQLRAAGFEEIGVFTVPELSNLQFLGLIHPAEKFFGYVYDHPKVEPTFEIAADFADDSGLAGTNTTLGQDLEQRPGTFTIRKDGATVKEIFEMVRRHPKAPDRIEVKRENFVEDFKKGYARSMNWRLKKGGVSRDEIRRQALRDKQEMTQEQLEEVYTSIRESYVRRLQEGCIAQYLDERQLVASEWERVQDRTFAIPETLEVKEVIEGISNVMILDEEQRHALEKIQMLFGDTAINIADRILNENIGALGLRKVGEVQEPVPAVILMAPENNPAAEKLAA